MVARRFQSSLKLLILPTLQTCFILEFSNPTKHLSSIYAHARLEIMVRTGSFAAWQWWLLSLSLEIANIVNMSKYETFLSLCSIPDPSCSRDYRRYIVCSVSSFNYLTPERRYPSPDLKQMFQILVPCTFSCFLQNPFPLPLFSQK